VWRQFLTTGRSSGGGGANTSVSMHDKITSGKLHFFCCSCLVFILFFVISWLLILQQEPEQLL